MGQWVPGNFGGQIGRFGGGGEMGRIGARGPIWAHISYNFPSLRVLIPRTTMIHSKTNPELIKYGGACTLPSIHMERGRSRRE